MPDDIARVSSLMMDWLTHFQFLRPLWLLAIVPCVLLLWRHVRRVGSAGWVRYIAPDKLRHLRMHATQATHGGHWLLLAPLVVCCLALAGPSWQSLPNSVAGNRQAMVIMLDLSPSMLARDVKPDRLERAKLKLFDLLRTRSDGETALIVYSGDAHRVSPLTDDPATIETLVHALHPDIMPLVGSDPERALQLALSLFDGAGLKQGDIVLITDGMHEEAAAAIKTSLTPDMRLSILGVGTNAGAPVPDGQSGFLRDSEGALVMALLNESRLRELATELGGRYHRISVDNSDIAYLSALAALPFSARVQQDIQPFDRQHDAGYWLVLLLLPVAAYAFRRNLLWVILPLMVIAPDSHAWSWSDLWLTQDQQASRALQDDRADVAAGLFSQPRWAALAHYRNRNYQEAARHYAEAMSAGTLSTDDFYNLGNAEALAGNLDTALAAYTIALEMDEDNEDAAFNSRIIEALLQSDIDTAQEQDEQNRQGGRSDGDSPAEEGNAEAGDEPASNGEQQQVGGALGEGQSLDQQSLQGQGQSSGTDSEQQATGDPLVAQDASPAQLADALTDDVLNDDEADGEVPEFEKNSNKVLNPYSEQWLRSLPNDPGGYLRRKFQYQAEMHRQETGELQPALTDARY